MGEESSGIGGREVRHSSVRALTKKDVEKRHRVSKLFRGREGDKGKDEGMREGAYGGRGE